MGLKKVKPSNDLVSTAEAEKTRSHLSFRFITIESICDPMIRNDNDLVTNFCKLFCWYISINDYKWGELLSLKWKEEDGFFIGCWICIAGPFIHRMFALWHRSAYMYTFVSIACCNAQTKRIEQWEYDEDKSNESFDHVQCLSYVWIVLVSKVSNEWRDSQVNRFNSIVKRNAMK